MCMMETKANAVQSEKGEQKKAAATNQRKRKKRETRIIAYIPVIHSVEIDYLMSAGAHTHNDDDEDGKSFQIN